MEKQVHFKRVVNEESNRLESLCTKWQNILESASISISDDLRDQIRAVIGQTKLLIEQKLQQFKNLLKNYESGRGDNITQNDLEGFWDLVLIQINDLKDKFSQLEINNKILKARNI